MQMEQLKHLNYQKHPNQKTKKWLQHNHFNRKKRRMIINEQILKQVDAVYQEFQSLRGRSAEDDVSDLPEGELVRFNTRARALIHRIAGDHSPYVKQCEEIISNGGYEGFQAIRLAGVVDSLRVDVAAGYLETQKELVHGELFSDFLEMAQHLLDEDYKDAAAVTKAKDFVAFKTLRRI